MPDSEEKRLEKVAKRLLAMPHKPRGESKLEKREMASKKTLPQAKREPQAKRPGK